MSGMHSAGSSAIESLEDTSNWQHRTPIAWLQHGLGVALRFFFKPGTIQIRGYFTLGWLAFFLTIPVREANPGWLFATVSLIVSVIAVGVIGILTLKPKTRFVMGHPIFGYYGGLNRLVYRYTLSAADEMSLDFTDDDKALASEASDFDAVVTEDIIRWSVETEGGRRHREPLDDEAWQQHWQTMIGGYRVGDLTLKDVIADDNLSFNLVLPRLVGTASLIDAMLNVFNLIAFALAVGFVNGTLALVTFFQVGLIAAILLAAIVVVFLRFIPEEITFELPEGLAPDLDAELREKYGDEVHLTLRPTNIEVTSKYREIVGRFHSELVLRTGIAVTLTLASISLVVLLLGWLWALSVSGDLGVWYLQLFGVLTAAFIGLSVLTYLMFIAVDRGRKIVLIVAAGLAAAVAPDLFNYAFTGELDVSQVRAAFTGVVAALTVSVTKTLFDQKGE